MHLYDCPEFGPILCPTPPPIPLQPLDDWPELWACIVYHHELHNTCIHWSEH